MPNLAVCLLLGLAACSSADSDTQGGAVAVKGWELASGKAPTQAEFAAVVAACENRAVLRSKGKPLDACLDDLGLKRVH